MRCPTCREFLDPPSVRFCPACGGAVPAASEDPLLGVVVGGRYRVTQLVAEGGMGRIYEAEQTMGTTSRKVAIKVLVSEYSGREHDMQRFARECSMVTELEHPNTIRFYDYGETPDGDLYIAMEYLSGPSLAEVLRDEGPISPERVDVIVGQICGSLEEAHQRGIVHRDLKPDNVILTSPGGQLDFVKVLDFGIAKRTSGRDPKLTPLGVVLGSPPYMAPEQFTLQDADPRSDLYALGVVSYQMLTGMLPFRAVDPLEWATLHMTADPHPIEEAGLYVPPSMKAAILHALAKEPARRPATARDFYAEFTLGTGTLPPGRPPSMMPGRSNPPPRHASSRPPSSPLFGRASVRPSEAPMSDEPTRLRQSDVETRASDPASPHRASGATPAPAASPSRPEGPPSDGAPPTVRDASSPELDVGGSIDGLGKQGTIVMASAGSGPPPAAPAGARAAPKLTMPDLLPPTIRDGAALEAAMAAGRGRSRWPWIALVALLAGAGLACLTWYLWPAQRRPRAPAPTSTDGGATRRTVTDAPPTPVGGDPERAPLGSAAPSASAAAGPGPERSPCQTAIFSAVQGRCDVARRAHARCAADSPYRASADRAMTGLCAAP